MLTNQQVKVYAGEPLAVPDDIIYLLKRLEDSGHEAYIVGGAVRDGIMGRACSDYDIATSALPEQTKQVFSDVRTFDTGIKHGTVTVLTPFHSVEVTTYRSDGSYSDGRHPDGVTFSDSILHDLARRDFSINAVAYNPKTGIKDPFGGIKDISDKIIRCVNDPYERFTEDKLRMIRALRFSSVLGFSIDEAASQAIHSLCGEIGCVSMERIFSELSKMLRPKSPEPCFLFEFKDLLFKIIPELEPTYEANVHMICKALTSFSHAEPLHIPFSALLYGIDSVETVKNVSVRLRASSELTKKICTLTEYKHMKITPHRPTLRRLLGQLGADMLLELLEFQKAFGTCLEYEGACECVGDILEKKEPVALCDLKVNGNDLISLGISPGKEVGRTLSLLLDAVINDRVANEKAALLSAVYEISRE